MRVFSLLVMCGSTASARGPATAGLLARDCCRGACIAASFTWEGADCAFWIGNADLDRLFSYPQRHNLSSSWFPIHFVAARAHTRPHVGPMICAWAAPPTRISKGSHTHQRAYVRIKGLTRIFSGSRATNTPRQTPNPPKRRPIQPQPSVLVSFCPMGLHCGGRTASSRGLAVTNRGELHYTRVRHAGDTP